jgi:phosphoserine phosphatase RsbU/P
MTVELSGQYHDLFSELADRWRQATGGDLLFVSPQGEILDASRGTHQHRFSSRVSVSPDGEIVIVPPPDSPWSSSPVFVQGNRLGFLLSFNTDLAQQPLLEWAAATFSTQIATQQALFGMTDELIEAWDQLELVYRVIKSLGGQASLTEVLRSIIREIRQAIDTEEGFVLLEYSGVLKTVTCNPLPLTATGSFDSDLLRRLLQSDHIVICEDADSCHKFWPAAPQTLYNLIATRIPTTEVASAAIGLANNPTRPFNAGDVKLITAMADHLGAIIDNFLLHQQLIAQERVQRELEIAAEIQTSLLPHQLPNVHEVTISVASLPANEVGGDFYDFVTRADENLTVIVGDVAGKGIPAAMLTSMTRMMLRVEVNRNQPPHKVIERANQVLHFDLSQADSFVTAFVATIDTAHGVLSYANAGHAPPLLWRSSQGASQYLRATSPPMGITGYDAESTQRVPLMSGDVLVVYTDGLTEATNPAGELFGLERLQQLVDEHAHETPGVLQTILFDEVEKFRQSASRTDDATCLVVKVLPQAIPTAPRVYQASSQTVLVGFPANLDYLEEISRQVTGACRTLSDLPNGSAGDDFVYLVELAVSEICTNIIQHSYAGRRGDITGQITLSAVGIQIDLFDHGESFDPNDVPPPLYNPLDLSEGGYGLYIVRKVMDLVRYEAKTPHGNHWRLVKYLPV